MNPNQVNPVSRGSVTSLARYSRGRGTRGESTRQDLGRRYTSASLLSNGTRPGNAGGGVTGTVSGTGTPTTDTHDRDRDNSGGWQTQQRHGKSSVDGLQQNGWSSRTPVSGGTGREDLASLHPNEFGTGPTGAAERERGVPSDAATPGGADIGVGVGGLIAGSRISVTYREAHTHRRLTATMSATGPVGSATGFGAERASNRDSPGIDSPVLGRSSSKLSNWRTRNNMPPPREADTDAGTNRNHPLNGDVNESSADNATDELDDTFPSVTSLQDVLGDFLDDIEDDRTSDSHASMGMGHGGGITGLHSRMGDGISMGSGGLNSGDDVIVEQSQSKYFNRPQSPAPVGARDSMVGQGQPSPMENRSGASSPSPYRTSPTPPPGLEVVAMPTSWVYKDPQGNVQGPFATREMYQWHTSGYFKPDLNISEYHDTMSSSGSIVGATNNYHFLTLAQWLKVWGPRQPFMRYETTPGANAPAPAPMYGNTGQAHERHGQSIPSNSPREQQYNRMAQPQQGQGYGSQQQGYQSQSPYTHAHTHTPTHTHTRALHGNNGLHQSSMDALNWDKHHSGSIHSAIEPYNPYNPDQRTPQAQHGRDGSSSLYENSVFSAPISAQHSTHSGVGRVESMPFMARANDQRFGSPLQQDVEQVSTQRQSQPQPQYQQQHTQQQQHQAAENAEGYPRSPMEQIIGQTTPPQQQEQSNRDAPKGQDRAQETYGTSGYVHSDNMDDDGETGQWDEKVPQYQQEMYTQQQQQMHKQREERERAVALQAYQEQQREPEHASGGRDNSGSSSGGRPESSTDHSQHHTPAVRKASESDNNGWTAVESKHHHHSNRKQSEPNTEANTALPMRAEEVVHVTTLTTEQITSVRSADPNSQYMSKMVERVENISIALETKPAMAAPWAETRAHGTPGAGVHAAPPVSLQQTIQQEKDERERKEQRRLAELAHLAQVQQAKRAQTAKATAAATAAAVSVPVVPQKSLREIQVEEEWVREAERQQRAVQMLSNEKQGPALRWASGALLGNPNAPTGPSLADIQAQEQQVMEERKAKQSSAQHDFTTPLIRSGWKNNTRPTVQADTALEAPRPQEKTVPADVSGAVSDNLWDMVEAETHDDLEPETVVVQKAMSKSEKKRLRKKQRDAAASAPQKVEAVPVKTKPLSAAPTFDERVEDITTPAELRVWAEANLEKLNPGGLDVATFVTVVDDLPSPPKVIEFIQDTLGMDNEVRDFCQGYIARKQHVFVQQKERAQTMPPQSSGAPPQGVRGNAPQVGMNYVTAKMQGPNFSAPSMAWPELQPSPVAPKQAVAPPAMTQTKQKAVAKAIGKNANPATLATTQVTATKKKKKSKGQKLGPELLGFSVKDTERINGGEILDPVALGL
ncbi:hypothetical protein SARC_01227 [Sphaeroforma arctica JP610]|uniref:GYF domain-containing protein n=1 Tax=Sphaeroforma arctica JP610 TaxID=667725 RepID=A0A0L0GEI1_9EUKA|nr:hypothetical protein SARC_01227 [Sphaeroforma arctica JP610]KNC86648.1 hypothetical protein SARC_01227 [Sphaeroforma arctica JP610]|eukprot:XP_014160550.1 hypothetical protein SARC_01227 [Sphaeroforma arctica JP610]